MSDAGYVRIHRKVLGHPAFRNDAEAMAFAWMILRAAWKQGKVRYKGHNLTLERGQLSISVRDFAEAMDRPKGWVERLLERLKKHRMIEQKSRTGGRTGGGTPEKTGGGTPPAIITICNYDEYQAVIELPRTPSETPDETHPGQTPDTEQRKEKGKGETLPPTPHRDRDWLDLPDWIPAEPWNAWLDMRKDKGKWPTAYAVKLTVGKLTDWRSKGHDPGPILDTATENNWTTIYEPKETKNGSGQANRRNTSGGYRERDDRSHFSREIDKLGGLPYDRPDEPAEAAERHATGSGGDGGEPASAQVISIVR